MASITDAGVEPTTLTTYHQDIIDLLQEVFGQDLNTDDETPQGQLAGVFSLFLAAVDEVAVHSVNGLNLFKAAGLQLDDIGTLFDNPRIVGERSSVTATLSGTASTVVSPGARARTGAGAVFFLEAQAIIDSTGSVDATFRSMEFGPIAAAAGELSQIVDVISGWTGITNAAVAVAGRDRESDTQYHQRYRGEVAVHARDAVEAIRARVLAAPAVTDCRVVDNDTSASVTVQGIDIAAGATLAIVEGGTDADVALAIAQTKPAGGPTVGDQMEDVTYDNGQTVAINFRRVAAIPIAVTVEIVAQAGFPSTGLGTIRQNLLQWFSGTWPTPGPGIFDQSGVGIGEEIDLNRLRTPINAVPGHSIDTLTVTRVMGGAALGTPNLDQRYTLATGDITLSIVTP